jgi:peptide/nickel transport system ATP-binding protein
MTEMTNPLLQIRDLDISFRSHSGQVDVVKGFDLTLSKGETVGIVGESGGGKTISMLALARLLPRQAFVSSGSIQLGDTDLLKLDTRNFHRQISGKRISMIFQEPMTALNPVYTIGRQLTEMMTFHENAPQTKATARAIEMLQAVHMPQPEARMRQYPHQLSGGQRQRVMIAMALACSPDLLIADEPTTALDVTIQAQILDLLRKLQREFGMSIMLITHDLGVVAETSDEVVVMYAGRVVERAVTEELFAHPRHHYTAGLLGSVPSYGDDANRERLQEIPGMVPALHELPEGCKFESRCPAARAECKESEPELVQLGERTHVRCHFPLEAHA